MLNDITRKIKNTIKKDLLHQKEESNDKNEKNSDFENTLIKK